jgi:hypothetical protein
MNWDAIGAIAELLGAVGVIASLIYLARQMGQNARATRAASYQQFEISLSERITSQVNVPGLARIVLLGMSDLEQLNEEETRQFSAWHYANMRGYDNAYYQYRLGMFDEDRWRMCMTELKYYSQQPGSVSLWDGIRETLSSEFIALVNEILGEEPERADRAQ